MIKVGQKAPDFKLFDTEKKEVSLSDFKGKNLIVFFFPMAWTGVCTKEMCSIQDNYNSYKKLNTAVVGISVDSILALKRFREDNNIEFPMLSDFNRDTIRAYDVVLPEFNWGTKNVAKRSTFLIDEEGIVKYVEILPSASDLPNLEAIKEALTQTA